MMVDKIAIQKDAPGQGPAFLVFPEQSTRADEKTSKSAYKNAELIQATRQADGRIYFTDEVVEALAFVSATEVPGLALEISANDLSQDRMLKKSKLRGISVQFVEEQIHIYLSITVRPGFRPVCVAKEVQERVRKNVENMTGLVVAAVNVHVASIQAQGAGKLH